MDDSERIPIPLDDPPAAVGVPSLDGRGIATTLAEDGTLRIELPVAEPCSPDVAAEITVCAVKPTATRSPSEPTAEGPGNPLALRLGKNATLAPEAAAGEGAMGGSGVGAQITLRVKF